MTINLKQVINDVESVGEVNTAFYDMQTGERDEAMEELIESCPRGRFLRFPTKYEIHEYSIIESFIEFLPSGAARQVLAGAIRGRGAFRRFKNGIYYHWLDRQWYDYKAQAYREIAIRWCKDKGIECSDEN